MPQIKRLAAAHVALEHARARAVAEHHDDVREDRFVLGFRVGEHELDRRVERHPGRHVDERAAVLEGGRERGEALGAPVDHRPVDGCDQVGVRAQRVGERQDDDARVVGGGRRGGST